MKTPIYVLTIDECILSFSINIGRALFKRIISPPRRCFKCSRYGHCADKTLALVLAVEMLTTRVPMIRHVHSCSNCGELQHSSSRECFNTDWRRKLSFYKSEKRSAIQRRNAEQLIVMSHSLLWRHIVLLTVGVYSSNHRVFYTIGISMTRRCQKSVGPSVCNADKKSLLLHY